MNPLDLNFKEKVLIIDASALIHKSYHALPELTDKQGELVNAVFGFFSILLKIIKDLQPRYIITAFDAPGKTFRHQKYKKYKATREKTPEELIHQIPQIEDILHKMNIPVLKQKGMEADDIIATLSKQLTSEKEIVILTGDFDLLQLVNEKVQVAVSKTGVSNIQIYTQEKVREKYKGLSPKQLADLKALWGDTSDNIPGVPGVGFKTGVKLLHQASSLEELYQALEKNQLELGQALQRKLRENKEQAFLSKSLGELKDDVDLNFELAKYPQKGYNKEELAKIFDSLGFESLKQRL